MSIYRTLRTSIHLFLYRLQIVQELEECAYEAFVSFATLFLGIIRPEDPFLNWMMFSDACVFYVEGKVNRRSIPVFGLRKRS